MKSTTPRLLTTALLVSVAGLGLTTAHGAPDSSRLPGTGQWDFHILPKSFQKKPDLEMTVITEFTPVGRLLRPTTPDQPSYYIAQSGGNHQMGDTVGGESSPLPADLEKSITHALAVNGFLAANPPEHRPTLAVIYTWGSHNKMTREMARMFPEEAAKQRLERALLVGGKQFVADVSRTIEFGDTIFNHTERLEYLNDQADDDLYFVVASAYDYRALAEGRRQLLWRTSMTVNAKGVSEKETLLPLIATAAPYLGREMTEPQIAMRRISREGTVDVGTPTVIESDVPLKPVTVKTPAPAPKTAP
jgi:hypothetical protein